MTLLEDAVRRHSTDRNLPTEWSLRSASGLLVAGVLAGHAPAALADGPRAQALQAIEEGNLRDARKYIVTLDDALAEAKSEVSAQAVGFRYQAEARYHDARNKTSDTLKALRQACLVHPGGKPNPTILGPGPLVDTYYAVCSEVQQRPEVELASLNLPDAPVRIDGLVPGVEFPVLEGRHLVQVQCADATWSSQWSTLDKPVDWAAGCADGAVAAAEAEVSDDPMDMVPFFGADGGEDDTTTAADDHPVTLECTPNPCTVSIDGVDKGTTTLELSLSPGEHTFRLAAGDKTVERKLALEDGENRTTLTWNHAEDTVDVVHPGHE